MKCYRQVILPDYAAKQSYKRLLHNCLIKKLRMRQSKAERFLVHIGLNSSVLKQPILREY